MIKLTRAGSYRFFGDEKASGITATGWNQKKKISGNRGGENRPNLGGTMDLYASEHIKN